MRVAIKFVNAAHDECVFEELFDASMMPIYNGKKPIILDLKHHFSSLILKIKL